MVEKSAKTMQQARIAIRKGKLSEARGLLRQLVRDDPKNHGAWLLLARATPSRTTAMEYVKRAEALQPDSLLVLRARLDLEKEMNTGDDRNPRPRWRATAVMSGIALLVALIGVWLGPMAWEQVSALRNSRDANLQVTIAMAPTAQVNIGDVANQEAVSVLHPTPTMRPPLAAGANEEVSSEERKPEPTVEPTREPVPIDPTGLRPYGVGPDERWIDVDLNTQTLVAYEGNSPVYTSLISSGTWEYPTVTGQFRTYMKYETQDMNGYLIGYDYYLQNVPYVMYFSGNFAIHGAYWHNNFGVPMSHGCVNVNPVDAGWLFNWAPVGTAVNIH